MIKIIFAKTRWDDNNFFVLGPYPVSLRGIHCYVITTCSWLGVPFGMLGDQTTLSPRLVCPRQTPTT